MSRIDLIAAYHRRLFCGDIPVETRYARAWAGWENALASVENDGIAGEAPATMPGPSRGSRITISSTRAFWKRTARSCGTCRDLKDMPGTIVQGRYDMICPPVSAWTLAQHWKRADLRMIPVSGHALSEPGISAELIRVMDGLRA